VSDYVLTISASDYGYLSLTSSVAVNIHVSDINDNAPMFDQAIYNTSVMEGLEPGTSVVRIRATDRDDPKSMFTFSHTSASSNQPQLIVCV